jgi:hypothetical protein
VTVARFRGAAVCQSYPDRIEHILTKLPGWTAHAPQVELLSGEITDQNDKVIVGDETFIVRVCARGSTYCYPTNSRLNVLRFRW